MVQQLGMVPAIEPEHFVVAPFQNGMLLQHGGRAALMPRDAKVLRALVEAKGEIVTVTDIAVTAEMWGDWAHSDISHSIWRLRHLFENSLVLLTSHRVSTGLRGGRHRGWRIRGPIDIERLILPIITEGD